MAPKASDDLFLLAFACEIDPVVGVLRQIVKLLGSILVAELTPTVPRGQKLMTALYEELTKKRGFAAIIHGDEDKVVPLKENSAALTERYKQANAGDKVTLIVAEGQGHSLWEGFFRCQELVDFAVKCAKAGTVYRKR